MATSPELTGGSGFTFEDAVAAYYLAALLAQSKARGLEASPPMRVALQRGALGHPLDDLAVSADTPTGKVNLDLQVKRTFAFKANASNDDFFDVVRQAHATLTSDTFQDGVDRIGVATEAIAADHYRQTRAVCEWARDSSNAADFLQRIQTPSLASNAKREIVEALREGLARTLEHPASDDEVHHFFRHFLVLRFDLLGEAAADMDLVLDRIQSGLTVPDPVAASEVWSNLRTIARDASGRAGSFDRDGLRRRLNQPERFTTTQGLAADMAKLSAEARLSFQTIEQDIDGVVIPRTTLHDQVRTGLADQRLLRIIGQPGSGKSALLRAAADAVAEGPLIFLRSDRVEAGGWPAYAKGLGLDHATPLPVLREMACAGEPILFIDGVDRIVGKSRLLIQELVGAILEDAALSRWRIVVSLRDDGWAQVLRWLPVLRRADAGHIEVTNLSDEEATVVAAERPRLKELLFGASTVREISRRPFFLNVLASAVDLDERVPSSETELIAAWWAGGGYDAEGAQKGRRQEALVALARASAAALGRRARLRGLDHDALETLKTDRIVVDVEPGHTVSFAHDIFFEWAFAHLLMDADQNWRDELVSAGEPPALGRPVELLSQLRFERDQDWEAELDRLEASGTRTQWRRAWLLAPLSSPQFWSRRETFTEALFRGEDAPRLAQLLTWFQAVRAEPGQRNWAALGNLSVTDAVRLADMLSAPSDFPAWERLLNWLLAEQSQFPPRLWPSVLTCAEVWQNGVMRYRNAVTEGLLALAETWIAALEDEREARSPGRAGRMDALSHDAERALLEALRTFVFRAAVTYPEVTQRYLGRLLESPGHTPDAFGPIVESAAFVARADPQRLSELILALAKRRLPAAQMQYEREDEEQRRAEALKHPEGSRERQLLMPSGLGGWIDYWDWNHLAINGLEHKLGAPSPVTEPLRSLIDESPELGLKTIKDLANHAVAAWRELHQLDQERGQTPLPLTLDFPWGQQDFWGEERGYLLFRGVFQPQILTAGLMVLEAWAFSELEGGADLDALLRRVVEDCHHNAILGIAAALALTGPTASPATLTLATSARLWRWDMARLARVERGEPANVITAMGRKRDLVAIRIANARPARDRWVGNLAPVFMLTGDVSLREAFQAGLEKFSEDPALDFAEESQDASLVEERLRSGSRWAKLSEPENYVVEQTEDGAVVHARPPAEEGDAETLSAIAQTNRWLALGMWAARTFESAPKAEGGLSDDQAIAEARTLDEAELFTRGGGLGDLEDLRRTGVAGAAALVLKEPRFEDPDLLTWAEDVTIRAFSTPLGGEGWIGPESVLTHHPLKLVPIALAGIIRRDRSLRNVVAGLIGMTAQEVHEISVSAARASYSLCDIEPNIAKAALQLATSLSVRPDTPLAHHRDRKAAHDRRATAVDAAYQAALAVAAGEAAFSLPALPRRHDEEDDDPREGLGDEAWLDTRFLTAHLEALINTPAMLDDLADALGRALLAWTIEQSASPDRRRSRSNLMLWRGALMRWLASRAKPAAADRVIETIVAPVAALEDEPCLQLLGPFIGRFLTLQVHDAETIEPGTLAVMEAVAKRLARLNPKWRSDYDTDAGELCKDLMCVPSLHAGGARRFANGDWAEVSILWPIVDILHPALRGRMDYAKAWLALVEHAIDHYPIDRFATEAVSLLEALPTKEAAKGDFRARLGSALQALDERADALTAQTSGHLVRVLDLLIDGGDRRAASLQRSERFRVVPRESG